LNFLSGKLPERDDPGAAQHADPAYDTGEVDVARVHAGQGMVHQ
jgi:hypothetical protein